MVSVLISKPETEIFIIVYRYEMKKKKKLNSTPYIHPLERFPVSCLLSIRYEVINEIFLNFFL